MPAFLNIFKKKVSINLPKDPAILLSIIVIWFFLLLFVLFPLSKIFILTFEKSGHFTLTNILEILGKRNHLQAFWNSLLLATLVGLSGWLIRDGSWFFLCLYFRSI